VVNNEASWEGECLTSDEYVSNRVRVALALTEALKKEIESTWRLYGSTIEGIKNLIHDVASAL
jgi:hypothetical protein